jgi:hypothetical protein
MKKESRKGHLKGKNADRDVRVPSGKRGFCFTPEQIKAAIMLKNGDYSPSWISFKLHDLGIAKLGPNMVGAIVNGKRYNSKVVSWIEKEFAEELKTVSRKNTEGQTGTDSDEQEKSEQGVRVTNMEGLA